MPFKLKLKKTRQYNVASKSLFVISVELLDGGVADCTLSVDSTGQECLDNVCQRQAINQPEFFGLRFINRSQQLRWVQLDRPLKRQLDKSASSHQLYLRVMYYVISGTSLITDEVTRYHYFLQLKNDLVEGRILCDCQQAVVLASYSRQAEYGNHDRERHTVEYLKNLLTFPKQMIDNGQLIDGSMLAETGRLEWLTAAVIQHHMALRNMSQAQAEEGFITTCQQLRGYGQEVFAVHDQATQAELTVLVSLNGITRRTAHNNEHLYRWSDITNVINHKRTFSIECQRQSESASFVLGSPEDGKYVWRMCVLQHTFYMKHQDSRAPGAEPATVFHEHGIGDSRSELDAPRLEPLSPAQSASCLELAEHQPPPLPRNRALLPSYRPAPDYETAMQQKYQQRAHPAPLAKPLAYGSQPDVHRATKPLAYGSQPDVHRATTHAAARALTDDYLKYINYPVNVADVSQMHYVNVYKPPPPYPSNGLASNSTPDLAVASQALNYHRGYINSHVSGSSPDLVSTRTALNRQYLGYLNSGNHVVGYNRQVIPGAHGTYNNLASVLDPNSHIIMDPHHIGDNIQKVYDERGNIMYSMPMHRAPYQRHIVVPQLQQISKVSDTHEPIYENVPLPWRGEGRGMRDRAQSLTTTDEIARINERNVTATNKYTKTTINLPTSYSTKQDPDEHYVNAQIIKGVRESSVPKELSISNRSINRTEEFENVALSIDRLSLKDCDETPYQSLSTHKLSNNNNISKPDNYHVTIKVPDIRINDSDSNANVSHSSGVGSALSSSIINSTYSTDLETSNTTKSSVSSKEKKRRRWGVFMGRGTKADVKSATLGRDKAKVEQPANKHRWSTGLPKFQPLPPSITKETLCQLLERKMADDQLAFAFEQIPKGRDGGGEFKTALLPQHAALNQFSTDYLPYEDNRVRLTPSPTNPHGYINASHVTMTVGSSQRFFVVALVGTGKLPKLSMSSPLALQQSALVWESIWQVGSKLVVLVGDPHYLPPENTSKDYGKWTVKVGSRSSAEWGGSVRVTLRAAGTRAAGARAEGARAGGPRAEGPARSLWHVHYTGWPHDQPLPDNFTHFLAFLSEVEGLRLACEADAVRSPSVLAATNLPLYVAENVPRGSAGTTLMAHLLHHIHHTNQELDIPRTISILHQQRANLIQNVQQYKFLHQILLHYLKQSRLI